jgi:hypothetical protein
LFCNGPFELLGVLRIDPLPSFVHLRICHTGLDGREMRCLRMKGSRRRDNIELITIEGLTVVRLMAGGGSERNFNRLNILIRLSDYSLDRRPEVIDHVVISDNIGHVLSLADDLDVSPGWLDVIRVAGFMPMSIANKNVGRRTDIVIGVGPG